MRRVARALGNELPRERLEVLCSFRSEIARVPMGSADTGWDPRAFAAGYVESMLDVAAEFEVSLRQSEDHQTAEEMSLRRQWRDLLILLADGSRLPDELARLMHTDIASALRSLDEMSTAGLVQISPVEAIAGPLHAYRLTPMGRRMLEHIEHGVPQETVRGIRVAIALVGHMMAQQATSVRDLESVAFAILGDLSAAAHAVDAWTDAFKESGMMSDIRATAQPAAESQPEDRAPVASDEPWQRAPRVLAHIQQSDEDPLPVYVRTSDAAWPAWAFNLGEDASTPSRAIVDGDILTRSFTPPERPYRLVYDDPSALSADYNDPTMRALIEQADQKYVVAYPGMEASDLPQDFVAIDMLSEEDAGAT